MRLSIFNNTIHHFDHSGNFISQIINRTNRSHTPTIALL
jgi:deoxyinosine 3'endonuclease (endonuclease V)